MNKLQFNKKLKKELDKLYTAGSFNDSKLEGFELGAAWAFNFILGDNKVVICPKCKGNEYFERKTGYKCAYTDCQHEWKK